MNGQEMEVLKKYALWQNLFSNQSNMLSNHNIAQGSCSGCGTCSNCGSCGAGIDNTFCASCSIDGCGGCSGCKG